MVIVSVSRILCRRLNLNKIQQISLRFVTMRKELDRGYFVLPNETPFVKLECKQAFEGLSEKEKLYAHHISKASWNGSLIVFLQTSPESPGIFILLQRMFQNQPLESLRNVAIEKCSFTDEEFKGLLIYASGVYTNMGNYKGFGDTKIVPNVSQEKFEQLLKASEAFKNESEWLTDIWNLVKERMFSLNSNDARLGFNDQAVTTYHSANVTKEDTDRIDRYMKANGMEAWNTRLFKTVDKQNGKIHYDIRLAAINEAIISGPTEFEECFVSVSAGDYGPILKSIIPHLALAKKHAANENQVAMISDYIEHFTTGSLEKHKTGSRHWINDKGPAVETYIGFIENYRDPAGSRSEFEGFVAAVNPETTAKFTVLVNRASEILRRMPWTPEYEKDQFLKPDFTSLDVISFGGSGVPMGINIPNYDEIRQKEGFKNVSLQNVFAALPKTKINFLTPEDQELFRKRHYDACEVQVGLHELLGHGSGKLFQKEKDGTLNFDKEKTLDMVTGEPVKTWYEPGETWSTKFGALSSSYEECRAEGIGYFLSVYDDILEIFGHKGADAEEVKYCNWLSEIRAGLMGLEFYNPESKRWGQSHCHARFVLLRVAIEAGQGFVGIDELTGSDGKPDLLFTLDRTKIDSVGAPAVRDFVKLLQQYKSTGDATKGQELFDKYSVTEEFVKWRAIIIDRRQPRRLMVQSNTDLEGDKAVLKEYEETAEASVQSFVDRFPDVGLLKDLWALSKKDQVHFQK